MSSAPSRNETLADSASSGEATFVIAPSGFRLPAGLALGSVKLQVADLERSLEYYQRVLGLRLLYRSASAARLGAKSDSMTLVELRELPGATPVPRRGRLGLYHFAIRLPDRASLGRFIAHLDRIRERPGMSDHLVSEAVYLTDPDGLGIEVYSDRPREEWRVQGGAVAMATDPLDVGDLLRAAGDTSWSGAPAGTRMGHVHLHVSDLGEAERFFHHALGLDKVTLQFPGALFLSAGGYHHHLGTNTWAAGAPRAEAGDARLLEWTVLLPAQADVDAVAASLESSGFAVDRDGDDVLSVDPWGTGVRVSKE